MSAAPDTKGLPGPLPAGEQFLWQGGPDWKTLAVRLFHIRKVAIYFALLMGWRLASGLHDGGALADVLVSALWVLPPAAVSLGLLAGLAYAYARTTRYTITSRRLILQYGVAVPATLNLPFRKIESAAAKIFANGAGDIPVLLTTDQRIAYFLLWPHVRPWQIARTQPMLRAVPDAERVTAILGRALANAAGTQMQVVSMPKADVQLPAGAAAAAG